jgi:hypothetical protein
MHRAARECEKTVRSRLRVAVTNAFWARKNAYLFRFLRAAREPSRPFVPVRAVSGAREKQWRDGGGQHWRRDGGQHWRGRLVRRELTCRPRAYLSGRSGPAPAPAPAREKAGREKKQGSRARGKRNIFTRWQWKQWKLCQPVWWWVREKHQACVEVGV